MNSPVNNNKNALSPSQKVSHVKEQSYGAEKSQTDINLDEANSLTLLTSKLDSMYSERAMGELFDIAEARQGLQQRRSELVAECQANSKLQPCSMVNMTIAMR